MKKSIHIRHIDCLNHDFLKFLKSLGFDGISLLYGKSFFQGDTDMTVTEIAENLEAAGLKCNQVHLPYYEIFTSSETIDEEIENQIKYAFKSMKMLGAKWGALHPMSSTNFDYDRKRAMHDNKERIKNYLETASKYDVGIAVENIPIFPDCPQYHFFTSDVEDHIELVDSFNSPLVGICWDFGHANLMPYDHAEVLNKLGNRIKIVHAHNNYKNMDWHLCPALGKIDWNELLPVLVKNGFQETFSLELNIYPNVNKEFANAEVKNAYIEFCAKATDAILSKI